MATFEIKTRNADIVNSNKKINPILPLL